jgi:pimeloyl-ACP methyl ester carboxylesterase/DNA-binding response OmpR family regulator
VIRELPEFVFFVPFVANMPGVERNAFGRDRSRITLQVEFLMQAQAYMRELAVDSEQPADERELTLRVLRHELRTPVNHIIGYSEMLLEAAEDAGDESEQDVLNSVLTAGKQLLLLINETLAVENGAPDLAALADAVEPALATINEHCAALQQGESASDAQRSSDLHRIGSAVEDLRGLLAAEVRSQESGVRSQKSGGTSSNENEAHDGVVPSRLEDAQQAPVENGQLGSGGVATLLIVDDNSNNRDILLRRLEHLDYTILTAENGQIALDMLARHHVDLILLDIMMPELDGYQVLAKLKADDDLQHIPVIVLSALGNMESIVRCIEMGAEDYLTKPFDTVLLRARISASLARKSLRDVEHALLEFVRLEQKRANELLHVVIPLGVALTSEKDYNRLLERIVVEAQSLCNADGGTLYLFTEDQQLRFMIVRNSSLAIAMGGASGKDIPFPPLKLYATDGTPNYQYVVTHAALTGETINIADAYDAEGYDFSGTKAFDDRTGYRSVSLVNIPLKDAHQQVIGVLQLINARNDAGDIVPFDSGQAQMLESLGRLAAAALEAYTREKQLLEEIADLRIEIDQVKKEREVAQITQSSYFEHLKSRARDLRNGEVSRERYDVRREKVYVVNEQPIHVCELGAPHRRLVLMIHGWSSSWYALSPLLGAVGERYRYVAVDLPGYGESPRLPERATIAGYADLLADFIRQNSAEPAYLIGHSMGGMISLTMALRHPDVVERMVLLCPTVSGNLSAWVNTLISPITMLERYSFADRAVSALEPYMVSVTDRLMRPASFAERTTIAEGDYLRLRADARRSGQGRVRAECYWAMRQNDLRGKLDILTVPSLVIWGMEDNTVPLRDASVIADELPGAELRVLPKAGHWPQFETPDITRRYVRSFLSTPLKLLKAQF